MSSVVPTVCSPAIPRKTGPCPDPAISLLHPHRSGPHQPICGMGRDELRASLPNPSRRHAKTQNTQHSQPLQLFESMPESKIRAKCACKAPFVPKAESAILTITCEASPCETQLFAAIRSLLFSNLCQKTCATYERPVERLSKSLQGLTAKSDKPQISQMHTDRRNTNSHAGFLRARCAACPCKRSKRAAVVLICFSCALAVCVFLSASMQFRSSELFICAICGPPVVFVLSSLRRPLNHYIVLH